MACCLLEHAPINYFLAAVVATKTFRLVTLAPCMCRKGTFLFHKWYSEDMLGKFLIVAALVSGVILMAILNSSTPASAGAFGILTVFVCAYLFTLSLLSFLLYGLSRIIVFITSIVGIQKKSDVLSLNKAYYYSTILALVPVIIISMQSIGGVGPYELMLIGIFVSIGLIYVTKRTAR